MREKPVNFFYCSTRASTLVYAIILLTQVPLQKFLFLFIFIIPCLNKHTRICFPLTVTPTSISSILGGGCGATMGTLVSGLVCLGGSTGAVNSELSVATGTVVAAVVVGTLSDGWTDAVVELEDVCGGTSLLSRRIHVATFMFNCWGRSVFLPASDTNN